jgi:hypothetical protein
LNIKTFAAFAAILTSGVCLSFETICVRPSPGQFDGSCEARKRMVIEKSPHVIHKWITCMQEERGWGSGGNDDAVFFFGLVTEWEKEVAAHLITLDNLLASKDRKDLHREQLAWEKARARAMRKKQQQPIPQGSMDRAFASIDTMNFPEQRALELGCRVEKLIPKQRTSSDLGD